MDTLLEFLRQPFSWGLGIGLFFFLLSLWFHIRTKIEFSRFRRLLTDKLELESKQYDGLRRDNESLRTEAENLRHKVATLSEKPDNQLAKELEILARAEKQMHMSAPGFAPAWETAKSQALEAILAEEQGKSLPKRIFRRFFGPGAKASAASEITMEDATIVDEGRLAEQRSGAASGSHSEGER